ncbi:hypothetical protein GW17_00017869 [Ensete ventricosum]|nr:hypothetical protein GW17_00017869 [Ensete ventricosum]
MYVHKPKDTDKHEHFIKHLVYILTVTRRQKVILHRTTYLYKLVTFLILIYQEQLMLCYQIAWLVCDRGQLLDYKRRRVKPPPQPPSTPLPSSPLLSPPTKRKHGSTAPRLKSQRSLSAPLADAASEDWELLPVSRSELSLPLTLPTGQTLRHLDGDPSGRVAFMLHNSDGGGSAAVRAALADYLNLRVSLADLWSRFSSADSRFAELAGQFDGGARVLRQDPVECVFQFLCSSNNNIGRIEKMVGVLSSFGEYLGTVGGFDFHEFPSLEKLSPVTEQQLRAAGFGYRFAFILLPSSIYMACNLGFGESMKHIKVYLHASRAKYIVGAVRALQAKPGGGAEWLASLRGLELDEVIDALCTLPGVGPKVAACIALFSLDQHHAIPVDTHVWQVTFLVVEIKDCNTGLCRLYRAVLSGSGCFRPVPVEAVRTDPPVDRYVDRSLPGGTASGMPMRIARYQVPYRTTLCSVHRYGPIATQYLMPELAGTRLTPKLCRCVSEAFVAKFGEYAGWAQNVLFIGELPSQKVPIQLVVATLS